MNNPYMIILLTIITLANLFLLCVLVHYWRNKKDTASKTGFAFMAILTVFNLIFTIAGAIW